MKKLFHILLTTFLCLFLTENLTSTQTFAAESSEENGIEVSISSDKDEYSADEEVKISFNIHNYNEQDIEGASWKISIPEGLELKSGDASGSDIKLIAGESFQENVIVEKSTAATTTTAKLTTTTTTKKNTVKTDSAKTGDDSDIAFLLSIIGTAAVIAFISRKRNQKTLGLFSLLFCTAFIAMSAPTGVFSAENESFTINVEKSITLDGSEYKIELSVTVPEFELVPTSLYAWAEYSRSDDAFNIKWLAQEDAANYKVYDKSTSKVLLTEVSDTTEYLYSIKDPEAEKYVFCVEKENTDGQKTISNNVTVKLNKSGSYVLVDIDSDNDGLKDLKEITHNTDRLDPDTDKDGLLDGYEVSTSSTDPLSVDSNDNGIPDGAEDFEGDGLTNVQEYNYSSNPYSGDTDEDGFPDGYEIANGMDPLTFDEIVIDKSQAASMNDYTETDLEAFNENEKYPLEIYHNDFGKVERINGVYTTDKVLCAQDALMSLYNIRTMLGIEEPANELKYVKSNYDKWTTSYSFGLTYNGIEIEGRSVTVSCDKTGKTTSIFSSYPGYDKLKALDIQPDISSDKLSGILKNADEKSGDIKSSDICIKITDSPALAYKVLTSSHKTYWIDAHTGEIIDQMSNYSSAYDNSEFITAKNNAGDDCEFPCYIDDYYYMYDEDRNIALYKDFRIADEYRIPGIEYGDDNYYNSIDPYTPTIKPHWFKDDEIIYDSDAVTAYDQIRTIWNIFSGVKSYKGFDGKGSTVRMQIGLSIYGDYTSPNGIFDHDGTQKILILDGCTPYYYEDRKITGHEFGHAIFHNNVCSHNTKIVQTINEAYADIFGSWADLAHWMEYDAGSGLRNIPNPSITNNPTAIGGANFSSDYDDPHQNSTIISHAFYLLNTEFNISFDRLYDLAFKSLSSIDDSYTFNTLFDDISASAREIGFSEQEILNIREVFSRANITGEKGKAQITVMDGNDPIQGARITFSMYGEESEEKITDSSGKAVFDNLSIGSNTVKITVNNGRPIYTQVLVSRYYTARRTIKILTAKTNFDWEYYDHENYQEPFVTPKTKHIFQNKSTNVITMYGYTEDPIKDFMLTHENDVEDSFVHYPRKVLSFKIERDMNNWHTMEGGGFLFDVSFKNKTETAAGRLSSHCILVTQNGLQLYQLNDVYTTGFRNGTLGNIRDIGIKINDTPYDIGDVCDEHEITIHIIKSVNEFISVWCDGNLIIDNLQIPKLEGDDFGPITSHDSHYCEQVSWFTFSDIQMSNVS